MQIKEKIQYVTFKNKNGTFNMWLPDFIKNITIVDVPLTYKDQNESDVRYGSKYDVTIDINLIYDDVIISNYEQINQINGISDVTLVFENHALYFYKVNVINNIRREGGIYTAQLNFTKTFYTNSNLYNKIDGDVANVILGTSGSLVTLNLGVASFAFKTEYDKDRFTSIDGTNFEIIRRKKLHFSFITVPLSIQDRVALGWWFSNSNRIFSFANLVNRPVIVTAEDYIIDETLESRVVLFDVLLVTSDYFNFTYTNDEYGLHYFDNSASLQVNTDNSEEYKIVGL